MTEICNYNDFTAALLKAGFSMGGGNTEGIYGVINWGWDEQPPYETPVKWHTGNADTDPWEWRIRVLDERNDIAYSKAFFKKSGYITKAWYPYFLAARRGNRTFEEEYTSGTISQYAKRIYDVISANGVVPLHIIKQLAGFGKDEKTKFETALTELQMMLFITMCGRQHKLSQKGQEYGWSSTVFCTTESFWGDEIFKKAANISKDEAVTKITEQIYTLNPNADAKKITKFIKD